MDELKDNPLSMEAMSATMDAIEAERQDELSISSAETSKVYRDEIGKCVFKLQVARYAMHKVRLAHYQTMMRNGVMQPDIAKQFYLAAMNNYDDMMKASAKGCFSEAIEREMKEFDINEAFAG